MVFLSRLIMIALLALAPPLVAAGEVSRASQAVDGERVMRVARESLVAWLEPRGHEIAIEPVRVMPALRVPAGTVSLRSRALPAGQPLASRMQVWVDVWVDGRFAQAVPASFQVRAFRSAWVAMQDVARGPLQDGAFEQRRIDVAAQGAEPWNGALQGLRVARPLLAGHVLTARHVEALPAVERGDRVVARSRVGDIALEARAEAMQQGSVGQRVLIKVANAQGPVLAQVVERGVVEVKQ